MNQANIASTLQEISILALPVVLAITFHEAAHGIVAYWLGDDTAYKQGRVSLNPLRHIDPFGTVLLPILLYFAGGFLFGYARPVPTKASRLHSPRRDMVLVALAGPGMNIALAFVSALLMHGIAWLPGAAQAWASGALDASIALNLVLAVFNLIPLPPLDGSHVIASLLPRQSAIRFAAFGRYGILILIAAFLILPQLSRALGLGIDPVGWLVRGPVEWLYNLIVQTTATG